MQIDPYHQLKTDLYSTVPDVLVCPAANPEMPYRLIFWERPLGVDEVEQRIADSGAPRSNFNPWMNPTTGERGLISVIETVDENARKTIGAGLLCSCYRVMTPKEAEIEDAQTWAAYPWRIMCRERPPLAREFEHLLHQDAIIVRNTGYRPDCPRWAPDISWARTIYAIHVQDFVTANLVQMAIGDSVLEGPLEE